MLLLLDPECTGMVLDAAINLFQHTMLGEYVVVAYI